jgi:hypothetical protein
MQVILQSKDGALVPDSAWDLESTLEIPVDRAHDLAFAERAALYLEKQGLDHEAVVRCLVNELELDRETAEAVAALAA